MNIDGVFKLENQYLLSYLRTRMIDITVAKQYTREIHYTVKEKKFFAVGFQNDLGGFEIRSKYFKGSSSPKGITTIKRDYHTLNIFEGFFDFLSFLTWLNAAETHGTSIILNSVANIQKIYRILPNYININLYLDNDPAGLEAVKKIQNVQPDAINQSKIIYPGHKDFNEFLTHQ